MDIVVLGVVSTDSPSQYFFTVSGYVMTERQDNDKSVHLGASVFHSLKTERNNMTTLNNNADLLSDKLVDMVFITEFTGLSDKWFYKLISLGEFPKPIKLGRSSRWLKSEVVEWVQKRIIESRA